MEPDKVAAVRSDRDSRGKFVVGNKGGPGNPHAATVHEMRVIALKAVTPDDLKEIMATLIRRAKDGDVSAAKLLFDRVLGRAPLDIQVAFIDSEGNPQLGTVARVDAANHRYIEDNAGPR